MKKHLLVTLLVGIPTACFALPASFHLSVATQNETTTLPDTDHKLMKEAFDILDTKCNGCHRKRNPFMVFNEKNMTKRAPKIYRAVFIERKMPKGSEVRLSKEEYFKLEKWLSTQNIY